MRLGIVLALASLVLSGCTSSARLNGALWGAGLGLGGPLLGAVGGAIFAPEISTSTGKQPTGLLPEAKTTLKAEKRSLTEPY